MPPAPSRRLVAAAVIVLVAWTGGVSACSGGDSGNMSADTWRAQADALCTQASTEAEASKPVTGAGNPAVPVRARAALARQEADDLAALGRPKGQVKQAQALVKALDEQADALDNLADALLVDPTATAGTAGAAATVANDRVTEAAQDAGVPSCAAGAATTDTTGPDGGGVPTVPDPGDGGFTQES